MTSETREPDASRRPEDDTYCPTCGGSAHALSILAQANFGGQKYRHRYARKRIDEAWKQSDKLADELDSTYAHMRAVINNCKSTTVEAIRHQLVGLLPEVQDFEPEQKQMMREKGLGHLVERQEEAVQAAWREFGYGSDPSNQERD